MHDSTPGPAQANLGEFGTLVSVPERAQPFAWTSLTEAMQGCGPCDLGRGTRIAPEAACSCFMQKKSGKAMNNAATKICSNNKLSLRPGFKSESPTILSPLASANSDDQGSSEERRGLTCWRWRSERHFGAKAYSFTYLRPSERKLPMLEIRIVFASCSCWSLRLGSSKLQPGG